MRFLRATALDHPTYLYLPLLRWSFQSSKCFPSIALSYMTKSYYFSLSYNCVNWYITYFELPIQNGGLTNWYGHHAWNIELYFDILAWIYLFPLSIVSVRLWRRLLLTGAEAWGSRTLLKGNFNSHRDKAALETIDNCGVSGLRRNNWSLVCCSLCVVKDTPAILKRPYCCRWELSEVTWKQCVGQWRRRQVHNFPTNRSLLSTLVNKFGLLWNVNMYLLVLFR